jgi:hypothetical protein
MNPSERALLERLDAILRQSVIRAQIQPVVDRVQANLAQEHGTAMAWEPVPLTIFDNALPPELRSCWVFILRAGANTGAERHPNSHQRMMSFKRTGDLQIRAELESPWQSNVLVSDRDAPLERRWISIPQNIWHQPVVPKGGDWVVVSFHTVPAEELIEERPDAAETGQTRQRRYLTREAKGVPNQAKQM